MTRFEANVGEHFSNEVMAILPPCMARKLRHDTTHHVATARMALQYREDWLSSIKTKIRMGIIP